MANLAERFGDATKGLHPQADRLLADNIPSPQRPCNDGLRFPAKAIAVAIIESALADIGLICNNYHTSRQKRIVPRHQREACAWIMSRDKSYVTSFEVLCEYVDFDPGRIRHAASRVMIKGMV